ncbi:DUF475 domain-containing protein [Nakamurella multipartita]|uniref:Integral membrane protein TerC n=1 Tax=Nakamurella multipartita (strain ATCC 700099 / DSM 44233 / CIP 104796 / JCM 9543 / NBRC 105858 / Y-104) TaxID=479431 RepID=C8XAU9_NAKMY|nr:DUF475 domain-containing protein [Nakamurella multipartita]ACV79352.1 protein of unknown function DUF475 [Nakamurella multipartita DSM 44233]HOZ59753.1 DUF475 domain-containing protein [Nakamurella multipartita]
MHVKIFMWSYIVTAVSLVVAFVYGSWSAVVLCAILGVLEVSLSFDNAVINATILERMSEFWQKMFLTVGIVIAVFGMRLLLPLLIVYFAAGLPPVEAFQLAMNPPADGAAYFPDGSPSYETLLTDAHPIIAAFGGMFLLMLFLNWLFEEKEHTWLTWLERPLAKAGRLDSMAILVACLLLLVVSETLAEDAETVLFAGLLGLVVYLAVNGLGTFFENAEHIGEDDGEARETNVDHEPSVAGRNTKLVKAAGKAGFFLFLYLEVLDASFSFDGVIGAFAITSDPILIALGLGLIGAMFVRSLTVYLVRKGTLSEYVYLEHGAHWAIGALAVILMISIGVHISEFITGLLGVAFIGAAFISSIQRNKRLRAKGEEVGTVHA